jgi:hypothetical protein
MCAFEDFFVAIPIRYVSSLVLRLEEADRAVSRDDGTRNTFFSLPHLFGSPGEPVKHGIVLKSGGKDDEPGGIVENRNILLSPPVEREVDIPQEDIYPLPDALAGVFGKKSAMFTGIRFAGTGKDDSGNETVLPMLFLNPDRLVEATACRLYEEGI